MRLLVVFAFVALSAIGCNAFWHKINPKIKQIMEKRFPKTINVNVNLDPERAFGIDFVDQRLDNYNIQNPNTWSNLYFYNDDFFEPGGPIFIFVGGYFAEPIFLLYGLMYDIAEETNGVMFATEHRFYGISEPTANLSTENLQYLNHGQAMMDLARFISHIKEDADLEDSPVVLVSTVYGSSVASWFRKRFPHLVDGVWASSAPVEARADMYDFLSVVAEDIAILGGQNCHDRIERGFQEIEEIILDEDNDGSNLTEIFNLCQPVDTENELDVASFVGTLASVHAAIIEYGGEFGAELICYFVEDESIESDMLAVANFINWIFEFEECLPANVDFYTELIIDENWYGLGAILGIRQFVYQSCTEFGWFQTSNEDYQPFGNLFPLEVFHEFCTLLFGENFTADLLLSNIDRVNNNNGGVNPRVSNVIYTTGALDPLRVISIVEDNIQNSDVYVIPGETISSDLWPISDYDSLELFQVKRAIRRTILDWVSPDRDPVETRTVTQRIDNFNLQDTRTWEQRYMANGRYFEIDGPIYIFVGGQWQLDRLWLESGLLYDIARETNGYIVATEHRYYGESRPTEDLSPANLQYLTYDQAIADLANIILEIRRDREFRNSKVILVSTGYGATVATWFGARYPHLIEGVWASSARLEARFDFSNYFESVAEDISEVGGENCLERIVDGFEDLETLIQGNHPDIADLDELFDLCQNIDPDDIYSVSSFLHGLELLFSIFIEVGGEVAINDICNIMEDPRNPDPIAALADFVNYMYPRAECINIKYGALIDAYADHDWDGYGAISGGRQWIYQRCTEFAWFRSSPQSFTESVALEHFVTACDALFGDFFSEESINQAVDRVNLLNGGLTPNVRNAIYTNGALDPWISVGVTDDIEGSHVFVIPGESQSADLASISDYDSDELTEIKENIRDIIMEWVR